jgi:hypothetical protein
LTGGAAKVTNRGENSGNPSWVNRVIQDNSTDRQADRVSQNSRVGNTELKIGGSSRVTNTKSWVMENLANTESRVTQNSANTESQVTKNSANMENRVMLDSGGGGPEEGKCVAPSKRLDPWSCLRGITKTQKHRLQNMHQRELAEKK